MPPVQAIVPAEGANLVIAGRGGALSTTTVVVEVVVPTTLVALRVKV
ncbi:MAG: hypothetical protein WCG96_08290 [Actinomycetes bacterium]